MKNVFSIIPFMAGICFPVFLSGNLAAQNNPKTLAAAIMADSRLDTVQARALRLLTGFAAGTSYGEVKKYMTTTGDRDFLFSAINDKTILQRMEASMAYLLKERERPDLVWRTHDTSPHYQRIYTRSCHRAETHDRPRHCSQRFLRTV